MLAGSERVQARSRESRLGNWNTSSALWEWREDLWEVITLSYIVFDMSRA